MADENETAAQEQPEDENAEQVKCPSCGAAVSFDPATGRLVCGYCGHQESIEPVNETVEEMDFDSAESTANADWGAKKKTVECKSCGAVTIYDELEISSVCPYCGSNQLMETSDVKTIAPNGVCTFTVPLKKAGEYFKAWLKGKLFAPGKAKKSAKPEAFKGVYIPYWTFDSDTATDYRVQYGRNRTVIRNGKPVTVTDWYWTSGHYDMFIDDQLVCGTNRLDKKELKKVEPFDTKKSRPYQSEFVAGFASERYSVGLKQAWEQGREYMSERIAGGIRAEVRARCHASSVGKPSMSTRFKDITYKYLLVPIWLSSFTYKDRVYRFVVNGQSGKVGGKAPVSPLRVAAAVVMGIALAAVIYLLILSRRM